MLMGYTCWLGNRLPSGRNIRNLRNLMIVFRETKEEMDYRGRAALAERFRRPLAVMHPRLRCHYPTSEPLPRRNGRRENGARQSRR